MSEPVFAQARFPFLGETTADRVHVRAGQNNNFESLLTLEKGATVTVLAKNYNWYKVRLPQGSKAFFKASYATMITPQIAEVNADRVNVRAAANTTATVLGQVKKGKKFSIKENQGEWLWMNPVEEINGWIHESLIVFKSDKVPALASPDLSTVEKPAQTVPVVKAVELKTLANGQVECSGKLVRTEATPAVYHIMLDNVAACVADGPQPALDPFVGGQVIIQGTIKTSASSGNPAQVSVVKIRRSF